MRFAGQSGPAKPPFPLAAMIDILFLLMLFFMVTSLYATMEAELNVDLPVSKQGDPIERAPEEMIINVTADGKFVLKQIEYDPGAFDAKLAELKALEGSLDNRIVIRADKNTKWDNVSQLLDVLKKYDISGVSFAMNKAEEPAAAPAGTP
jgi:biopolymer transport protein ExbD